ncbi:helix-turn-helix transcriptional regulator [bacterium]|nr:helix-turn-helix transcriptional regulator [bacterium]
MRWEIAEHGTPLAPWEYHRLIPHAPTAASHRFGWAGLAAARFCDLPDAEFEQPRMTHHMLILFTRPPDELECRYVGVRRHRPPPVGTISVVPAGTPSWWRWAGTKSSLHAYLEPGLIGRVAAETFGLDPAREVVRPFDSVALPQLGVAMRAVDAELAAGGAGGRLAAESLANILAVHLIRHAVAPGRVVAGRDGALPRGRLRAVVEYVEEHLDGTPSLAEMAAVARLSPFHFARQFKTATGLPPHQYVIARRVERAKQLLSEGSMPSLAEVALHVGFSDQSQFARHFKRLVGVTPGQFRVPARTT